MNVQSQGPLAKPAGESALFAQVLTDLGVPHGFSARAGGVSAGMFASLNFGNPGELPAASRDPASNIRDNWRRLCGAIARNIPAAGPGLIDREIVEVHQIHGAEVCVVRAGEPPPRDQTGHDVKADAIVTDDPRRLVAVRVADCTPVLIASDDGQIVAAIHAGWRGVVGGVAPAAVRAMQALGAVPTRLAGAIGPCIGPTAFEVGPEVAAEFRRVFGVSTLHVRDQPSGKSLVDLQGALREQLAQAGLIPERIETIARCTFNEPAAFFSHRRDRGMTGRMVGVIGPRGV